MPWGEGVQKRAQAMADGEQENEAALLALGLARRHLQEVLLDRRVLPFGSFRQLPGCQPVAGAASTPDLPRFVALDGSAFDNLEVGPSPRFCMHEAAHTLACKLAMQDDPPHEWPDIFGC